MILSPICDNNIKKEKILLEGRSTLSHILRQNSVIIMVGINCLVYLLFPDTRVACTFSAFTRFVQFVVMLTVSAGIPIIRLSGSCYDDVGLIY